MSLKLKMVKPTFTENTISADAENNIIEINT
jgi:hypothetical protein